MKMKRKWVCMTLLVLSLVLAACGSSTTSATTGTTAAAASASSAGPAQGTLSPTARNLLGIFKLEGTDLAVDSTQAATLLPLWQAYRSLLRSGTAAPAELEAVQTQIGDALTAKQQDTIAAMNLTPQDMFAMAEQLGVTQAASTNGSDSASNRPFVFDFGGGGPGGAPSGGSPPSGGGRNRSEGGGGGFVPPQGGVQGGEAGGFDPSLMMQGTPQAGQPSRSGQGDRFSLALLDPLIELLKERAES
jgi:hypothetical protein